MKHDLMDILVCPICKDTLDLRVDDETVNEIIEGNLHCGSCKEDYPIENSIANLLPPDYR